MALVTLGLSHHRAPVEARERLAFTAADLTASLTRLRAMPGVDEAAILSTCNRTEIMTVTGLEYESRLLEWWRRERPAPERSEGRRVGEEGVRTGKTGWAPY